MEVISVLIAVSSVLIAVYCVYRVGLIEEGLVLQVEQAAQGLRTHIDAELEPLQKNVNKAFGMRAAIGTEARQLKTAEKYVVQDVMAAQSPEIMAALEFLSPRTKEYLEKNPELVMKLLPRLQALQSIEGFEPLDLFKPPGTGSDNRKHPFGNREQ